ncbi:MAG: hypothetical protein Q9165_004099 [Trypethelium subeluteriae]
MSSGRAKGELQQSEVSAIQSTPPSTPRSPPGSLPKVETTASSSQSRRNTHRPEPLQLNALSASDDDSSPRRPGLRRQSRSQPLLSQAPEAAVRWGISARLFRPRNYPKSQSSRLANPINFAPRSQTLPNLPVVHPQLQERSPPQPTEGRDEYPLLTLPEKRRSRVSATGSLVVQPSPTAESGRSSIALPRDKRASPGSPGQRNSASGEFARQQQGQEGEGREEDPENVIEQNSPESSNDSPPRPKLDKGKGKAIDMPEDTAAPAPTTTDSEKAAIATDDAPLAPQPHPTSSTDPNLEIGSQLRNGYQASRASIPLSRRPSTLSRLTQPSATEQTNPPPADPTTASDEGESYPWGPSHPCFPHPNPHRPLNSPLFASTRIIRVRRDYIATFPLPLQSSHSTSKSHSLPPAVSDRVPAFTNLYPEILAPWVSEPAFRALIEGVNSRLAAAFNPLTLRSVLDLLLCLLTCWLWEDLSFTQGRRGLRKVEGFVDGWNTERRMEAETKGEEVADEERDASGMYARVVSLRRTGLMALDIEVPDPGVGEVEEEGGRGDGGDAGALERPQPVSLRREREELGMAEGVGETR